MRVISLFSGAGGMDLGFSKANYDIVWANDFDKDCCNTYANNIGDHIVCGDLGKLIETIPVKDIDVIIGGPPCQGFSVAGKMDPKDPRSDQIWNYYKVVKKVRPRAFLMENVKALGSLNKWSLVREELLSKFRDLGYSTDFIILNASEFNVPQNRERVFFIGFMGDASLKPDLEKMLEPYKHKSPTVREVFSILDKAGTGNNDNICNAKITIASNPILRKSPYSGMLFNGAGRPTRIDGYSSTLPATMGGNRTPIIDDEELYNNKTNWVEEYHHSIMNGKKPTKYSDAPKRLRRLTVQEATLIQTFPLDYIFSGSQSSTYKQIGNAVPVEMGYRIGSMIQNIISNNSDKTIVYKEEQLELIKK